jgi:hypothetical protein
MNPLACLDLPPSGVRENSGAPPKLKSICLDGVDVTSNGTSSIRGVVNLVSAAGVVGIGPGAGSSLYGHISPP